MVSLQVLHTPAIFKHVILYEINSIICITLNFAEDTSKNAKIPPEFLKDDAWLLRFIRVRKFDIERAHVMVRFKT